MLLLASFIILAQPVSAGETYFQELPVDIINADDDSDLTLFRVEPSNIGSKYLLVANIGWLPPTTKRDALLERQTSDPRLMTLVPANNYEQVQAILDTWANEDTFFFTPPGVALPAGAQQVTLPSWKPGYKSMPFNSALMWEYATAKESKRYDWFLLIDQDSYAHLPRIRKQLEDVTAEKPLYLGVPYSVSPVRWGPGNSEQEKGHAPFCHGGSGYILSKALLDQGVAQQMVEAEILRRPSVSEGSRCLETAWEVRISYVPHMKVRFRP